MSKRSLAQISIRNPEFVDPGCLEPGTVLGSANLQAHVIVVRCNLGLLARKLAEQESRGKVA